MERQHFSFMFIGSLCGLAAFAGDFAVTFLLGYLYPGYHFLYQTQSELGITKSPVAIYMNAWGIIFSLLIILFARALRKTIFSKGRWQRVAVWLVVIYGLGEGLGSGLFPNDKIGTQLTNSAILHSILSGIGDAAIVLLPYFLIKIFPKNSFPKLHGLSLFVGITGPLVIVCFYLAKLYLLPYKGLWQRIYLLDYYILVIALAIYLNKKRVFILKDINK